MKNIIVTIGRQYGSGGREIGEKLAGELGFDYYDTMLLEKASERSGLSQHIIEEYDERLANKWLDLAMAGGAQDVNCLLYTSDAADE